MSTDTPKPAQGQGSALARAVAVAVRRKLRLADGQTSRVACTPAVLRGGVDERTGEVLAPAVLTERVAWAAGLVTGMAADLLAAHWNAADVFALAAGVDGGGRKLPAQAWMALSSARRTHGRTRSR
ncbi:hypothetical protein [Actinacidiphila oryziradicis]|uniref:Uncharacterized protein n=1 Tax=Actinacidiphila oryziradicis TaxID=2571141 RepID=A0A4V5MWS5_9ACTN|nr:hypothetical protein [Actinacidiphila oryziradicis]TJZ97418.1 hypothetical protein FCI23_49745 [Actinacidiphila oryziradicis]